MAGWVLTKGLQTLQAQINRAFPGRDRASDGTIGDQSHASGVSGHNPDLTGRAEWKDGDRLNEVRAWDMDSDLRCPGVTAQMVVDHIRSLPGVSAVLRYIIFNRKIYEASRGWKPAPYSGPSPHTEHIHFSGARSQAADSNTTFNYHLEDLVALTTDDKKWIAGLFDSQVPRIWGTPSIPQLPGVPDADGDKKMTAMDVLHRIYNRANMTVDILAAIKALPGDLVDEVAIAKAVLSGLDYKQIAGAVVDALPPEQAAQVIDELSARLNSAKG